MTVSALDSTGLRQAWDRMEALANWRQQSGIFASTRADQARQWFAEDLRAEVMTLLTRDPDLRARMTALEEAVARGEMTPAVAARAALAPLRSA
jgi:LAO/AO transport system kinase